MVRALPRGIRVLEALGKPILAAHPENEYESIMTGLDFIQWTERTILGRETLLAEMARLYGVRAGL
jgi:DNA-binding IclR family transcriptional regulator